MPSLNRRTVLLGAVSLLVAPNAAAAHSSSSRINPEYQPQRVRFTGYAPGTIVVDPRQRFLYHVQSSTTATRYGVGVGRAGLTFKGSAIVGRKAEWPSWRPTDSMIRRQPWRYARYRNGVPGGPKNPLGARALYLYQDGVDTYYRIHGTNNPRSIGRAMSAGCIRMLNEHVIALYERVPVGSDHVAADRRCPAAGD